MSETYNIYCDESCHLKNNGDEVSMLGYVGVPATKTKEHTAKIRSIKAKHHIVGEIKWTKVSQSKILFYRELIDYFLASEMIFRGLIIPTDYYLQTHTDDQSYYKLYEQLLNHKSNLNYIHNIYIDYKDSNSHKRVKEMKEKLKQYSPEKYGSIQTIQSYESVFVQLADLIMGAYAYDLNIKNKVLSKQNLTESLTVKILNKEMYAEYKNITGKKTGLYLIELKEY